MKKMAFIIIGLVLCLVFYSDFASAQRHGGGSSGDAGIGALIGAVSGLLFGTAVAMDPAYGAGYAVQTRYDNAYVQCMHAKGNQIPVTRTYSSPPPPPPDAR